MFKDSNWDGLSGLVSIRGWGYGAADLTDAMHPLDMGLTPTLRNPSIGAQCKAFIR